ncbi:ATPase [Methyloceanibacter methanicus]|uniref:Potassium-transporting ATPase KdpC subunit n=1 Tax=Methyloceanibacter methanicus TaxID=1774968 RepID=A0A1E3VWF7_9HYPH|nr:potassium-transporting ATPase subunit C [Methyloceanibacter methanicus]ODR97867.1 ATPase [Methyloceanibacter methanicus]
MNALLTSCRLVIATMLICVAGYATVIWGVGHILTPWTAQGSLITASDGTVIGSRLVAQDFTEAKYFWPRPSAVDYDGAGAGGSNKSPASADLTVRAKEIVTKYGATADNPLPAELAAASGAGLDPHISVDAARYQAVRVAKARQLPLPEVQTIIDMHASSPGGFLTLGRLVNVLEINLALDRAKEAP